MNFSIKRTALVLLIILANVGCDQVSKNIATEQLAPRERHSYLGDTFRLTYVQNEGAFLSMGSNFSEGLRNIALKVFPVLLLIGLLGYTLLSKSLNTWQIVAFSFILGGGFSNIYDRLLYGKVVDFMNMGIGDLRTGIFNFADVSIMIGLFMMIPFMFKSDKKEKEEEQSATQES